MYKVAFWGHSLVPPEGAIQVEGCEIQTYRVPGAKTGDFRRHPLLRDILVWPHDLSIIYIGGNDITTNCNVTSIVQNIEGIVGTLERQCGSEVAIILVEPRVVRPNRRNGGLTQVRYNRIAQGINNRLKRRLRGHKFFHFGARPYREHRLADGVHPDEWASDVICCRLGVFIEQKCKAFRRELGL